MGGVAAAFLSFIAAALVMTILIFSLSFAIASAQERLIETLKTKTVMIKKWGGRVLILVGTWLIALTIWADTFALVFPV